MKLADLFIKLGLKKDGFDNGIEQAKQKTNSFGSVIKKIGGIMAAAFAGRELLKFASGSLNAYNKQISAEASLLVALKGRKDIQQELIKQAGQLQKTTLFADEDTIKAQANLAMLGLNKNAIEKLIPLVQDFATAEKMDLFTASTLVAKSVGSSTNALSRYGITITGAVNSSARLNSAVNALTKTFGGQAAVMAKLGTGPLVQVKNLWGDFTEKIGGVIARSRIFQGIMSGLNKMLTNWNAAAEYHVNELAQESAKVNILTMKLTDQNTKQKERVKIYNQLKAINPDIVSGINKENINIQKLTENLQKYNAEMVKRMAIEEAGNRLKDIAGKAASEGLDALDAQKKAETELGKIKDSVYQTDKKQGDEIQKILLSNSSLTEKIKEIQKLTGVTKIWTGQTYVWSSKIGDMLESAGVYASAMNGHLQKQNQLQDELNSKTKIYQDTFGKAFGETPNDEKTTTKTSKTQQYSGADILKMKMEAAKQAVLDAEKNYNDFLNNKKKFHGAKNAQDFLDTINKLQQALEKTKNTLAELQSEQERTTGKKTPINEVQSQNISTGVAINIKPELAIDHTSFDNAMSNFSKHTLEVWGQFKDSLTSAIQSGLATAITSFAELFGKMASGAIAPKDFGKQALAVVGKFIEQMGTLLIGYAMQMAIVSLNIGNPIAWPLVLAAGVAMVAIGAAISNMGKSGLSGATGSYSTASGYTNYNSSSGGSMINGNVVFKLEGSTLKGVLNNTDTKNYLIR